METIIYDKSFGIRKFNLLSSLLSIVNENNEEDAYFVLAKYLLEHFDEIDQISIYDLADACFISRSSIQRFMKYIGFESFTALKQNAHFTKVHSQAYIDYADRSDFDQYFIMTMNEMMSDISEMIKRQNFSSLADEIYASKQTVILIADIGSSSARQFQQGMATTGKLIRLVTDSTSNLKLLKKLTPEDLMITVSVTGNYALSILDDIQNIQAKKILITLNHSDIFTMTYDHIFYISKKFESCDYITNGLQNVYTRHGSGYLFDLLLNLYIQKYTKKK